MVSLPGHVFEGNILGMASYHICIPARARGKWEKDRARKVSLLLRADIISMHFPLVTT